MSRLTPAMLLTALAAICFSRVAAYGTEASYNLAATFDPIKAQLEAGKEQSILMIGDSLTFRTDSYLFTFESLMQKTYGSAGVGYQGFSNMTGGGSFVGGGGFYSGWSLGAIDGDSSPHQSLDGLWATYASGATSPNDAYLRTGSATGQLQFVAQPGGGSFNLYAWGNTSGQTLLATIKTDTNATTPTVETYNYTLPSGDYDLHVVPNNNGNLDLLGVENTSASQVGVRVDRAANGGWGIANFLQRNTTFDSQVKLENPSLVTIWLGQNDRGRYTESQYASAISQLVTRIEADVPNSRILLIGTYNSGDAALVPLVQGMDDVAHTDNIGFLNMYSDAGTYQFFQSNNYLASDGVHFSAAGGQYVGNLLFTSFQTDGSNLVPEPSGMALLAVGATILLARGRRSARA